ncbi:hypothetical protein GCM10023080_065170 [Streptomyces pseudoechinosporeus]
MTNAKKMIYTTLGVAIIPLVVRFDSKSVTSVNGEITSYTYFSVSALLAGLVGIACLIRMYSTVRFSSSLNKNTALLLALLALVSLFQLVRGIGGVPSVTKCTAEYSLDLCIPVTE